ncbi:MAG: hypothetical protein OXG08_01015 [Gammaproteobacteria bacterium]|nr:hypothetical protein [Gammaproteobacteria bacterium]
MKTSCVDKQDIAAGRSIPLEIADVYAIYGLVMTVWRTHNIDPVDRLPKWHCIPVLPCALLAPINEGILNLFNLPHATIPGGVALLRYK